MPNNRKWGERPLATRVGKRPVIGWWEDIPQVYDWEGLMIFENEETGYLMHFSQEKRRWFDLNEEDERWVDQQISQQQSESPPKYTLLDERERRKQEAKEWERYLRELPIGSMGTALVDGKTVEFVIITIRRGHWMAYITPGYGMGPDLVGNKIPIGDIQTVITNKKEKRDLARKFRSFLEGRHSLDSRDKADLQGVLLAFK